MDLKALDKCNMLDKYAAAQDTTLVVPQHTEVSLAGEINSNKQ